MLHNGPKKLSQNQGRQLFLVTFEGNMSKGQECSAFPRCSPASVCSLRAVSSCIVGVASACLPPSALPRMLTLAWMDVARYPCQPKQCVNASRYVTSTMGVFLDAISAAGKEVQNQKACESLLGLTGNLRKIQIFQLESKSGFFCCYYSSKCTVTSIGKYTINFVLFDFSEPKTMWPFEMPLNLKRTVCTVMITTTLR